MSSRFLIHMQRYANALKCPFPTAVTPQFCPLAPPPQRPGVCGERGGADAPSLSGDALPGAE